MEKHKAILIEDDPNWVRFFKETVVNSPHNNLFDFYYATTIHEAQAVIKKEGIVLVLLDLMLPDSQAQESVVWGSYVLSPVVILTTLADDKLMRFALQHGIEDYLLKDEYDDKIFFHVTKRAVDRFIAKITDGLEQLSVKFRELSQELTKLNTEIE